MKSSRALSVIFSKGNNFDDFCCFLSYQAPPEKGSTLKDKWTREVIKVWTKLLPIQVYPFPLKKSLKFLRRWLLNFISIIFCEDSWN